MPTGVRRRGGSYPVRLSLNIDENTSTFLDRCEMRTGRTRGELAREALALGLKPLLERARKRHASDADAVAAGLDLNALEPSDASADTVA